MPSRNIVVTGVAGYWGGRVATRLLALPDVHVIGVDASAPKEHIHGLDFIQADIRNALLADLLTEEHVDTLIHLAFVETDRRSEATFDLNVMGAMKVLGAAAAAGIKRLVIKSSTLVYGARPDNSAFLVEELPVVNGSENGAVADLAEIEAFCNGLRGQYPNVTLTVLRFPGIVGPSAITLMTRFLGSSFTPFLMGFDPLMQIIHEDDVVEALAHAVVNDAPGIFNVAAEGILPLSRVLGLAGTVGIPVFHLFAYWGNPLLGGVGLPVRRIWPIDLDYIRYAWVGDLAKMRAILDFAPRYTAVETLREFAGRKRLKDLHPDAPGLAYDEERLRDTLERRRRIRERTQRLPAAAPDVELISNDREEDAL